MMIKTKGVQFQPLQVSLIVMLLSAFSLSNSSVAAQSNSIINTSIANLSFTSSVQANTVVTSGQVIVVQLSRPLLPSEGMLAICIGSVDLAAKTVKVDDTNYQVDLTGVKLMKGEQNLTLHAILGDKWADLASISIKTDSSIDESAEKKKTFEARLTIGVKGQLTERVSGTSKISDRPRFQDLNVGIALNGKPQLMGSEAQLSMNLLGVSRRNEALSFGTEKQDASKLDLQDYRSDLALGDLKVSLGHQSLSGNPLLLADTSSRGVSANYAFSPQFDLNASAIRATSVVGFSDFFGLQNADHRIYSLGMGYEMFPSDKGLLRAELSMLDGKSEPQSQFNRGQIEDAERSKGIGVRLVTTDTQGRWKGDIFWARSKHVNPLDATLAQGADLVPVKPENRKAYSSEASYLLVKESKLFSDGMPLNVRGIVRYEYVDPLYKSLGASFIADQRKVRYTKEIRLGEINWNVSAGQRNDNVATIPTILKTGTYDWVSSLAIPLPNLFGTKNEDGQVKPAAHLPTVQLDSTRLRQYTLRIPDGTNAKSSFWPDQVNYQHKAGLNWSLEKSTIGYSFEYGHQDNRQTDRDSSDFVIRTHQLNTSYRFSEKLNLNLGANFSRNFSVEKQQLTSNIGAQLGIDWMMTDDWSVKFDYSSGIVRDSLNQQYSNSKNTSFQAVRKLPKTLLGSKIEGQAFVRLASTRIRALDTSVAQVLIGNRDSIQTGISVNF
jgi:TonB dependent receptor